MKHLIFVKDGKRFAFASVPGLDWQTRRGGFLIEALYFNDLGRLIPQYGNDVMQYTFDILVVQDMCLVGKYGDCMFQSIGSQFDDLVSWKVEVIPRTWEPRNLGLDTHGTL